MRTHGGRADCTGSRTIGSRPTASSASPGRARRPGWCRRARRRASCNPPPGGRGGRVPPGRRRRFGRSQRLRHHDLCRTAPPLSVAARFGGFAADALGAGQAVEAVRAASGHLDGSAAGHQLLHHQPGTTQRAAKQAGQPGRGVAARRSTAAGRRLLERREPMAGGHCAKCARGGAGWRGRPRPRAPGYR